MVLTYTRMMMSGLLMMSDPKNILIVGLGGGTLATALTELIPKAYIDVVEIDPAVFSVAKEFFNYTPNKNTRIILQDARVFTKRAASKSRRYDLIMLDAFNGDYIPEHLMTREYLQETRAILSARGVVVANTFSISRLYDHESETYFHVFGPFINFTTNLSGNRIVLASVNPLATNERIKQAAQDWHRRLEPYNVQITSFPKNFDRNQSWDRSRRVLTDQYSPANLLGGFE
jgi:spermidine synthase